LVVKRAVITNTNDKADYTCGIMVFEQGADFLNPTFNTEIVPGKNPKFTEELFKVQIDNCEEPFVLRMGDFGEIIAHGNIYACKWRDNEYEEGKEIEINCDYKENNVKVYVVGKWIYGDEEMQGQKAVMTSNGFEDLTK